MTAPGRVLRLVEWTLRPDMDADAPPTTYTLRCLTLTDDDAECGALSDTTPDPTGPQDWAFDHLRRRPGHTSFAELIERPWVMWHGLGPQRNDHSERKEGNGT
ncbi:hypothetical protein ACGFZQ_03275 [Streptomyces sp. NPDC048254]|uniref:DUF7848 domain-containing protein n=1 Tax=Streptomyces sp. NPDC048254 TaxID=3365525 RepID=UPI00370F854A